MPKLDDRLKAVAVQIRSSVHADIGSDHGHLIKALLTAGRIQRGIAIEVNQRPFENSRSTLTGLNADVRLADGLAGLNPGEADSLSICGMGGELIARILQSYPDRVPPDLVLQPNRCPEAVRRWALGSGYHLVDEQLVIGRLRYQILRFQRNHACPDPAYASVDRDAALLFGPLLIRRWEPQFRDVLLDEYRYLNDFDRRTNESQHRLDALANLLQSEPPHSNGLDG
ncbi:tRNA (adenine(22)-N(1))-methyltransferase [Stieleria maiorica]|uniref:tRNA (Adenine(22)-N(1))-methyltransferase n=1 Tax=Stieleria maiorica TaxID=2795974 RepID=A0A5B9MGI6_9BACT|nr:class I SAM-dependent methyltransferase [Stieleria maiorica]QEG00279.1 tRNA (adenine(22)-N(1))-methyltransferase [Stieleria maiorica]